MKTEVTSCCRQAGILTIFVLLTSLFSPAMSATIDPSRPTVLITGANRGIGLAFVDHYVREGWNVIATARRPDRATALQKLTADYDHIIVEQLDVTDNHRIEALAASYKNTPIDLLINNAGILGELSAQSLENLDNPEFAQIMSVNVFAPLKMLSAFLHSVEMSRQKKIVTVSSGAGSIETTTRGGNLYFYKISKTAVNMAMKSAHADLKNRGVIVALVAPGMVDTDMLENAFPESARPANFPEPLTPEESVAGMTSLISGLDPSYDGRVLNHDGQVLPW